MLYDDKNDNVNDDDDDDDDMSMILTSDWKNEEIFR